MNDLIGAASALALLIGSAHAQGGNRNIVTGDPAVLQPNPNNVLQGPAVVQPKVGSGAVRSINYRVSEYRSSEPPRVAYVVDPYEHLRFDVNDWRQHNLRAPPRGYHWIGNDSNKYLLVSIDSGIIIDVRNQSDHRSQRQWSCGQQLSADYMSDRYIVTDWRRYHLRRPARGTHWVRVDNSFMLATDATGVIVEIASKYP